MNCKMHVMKLLQCVPSTCHRNIRTDWAKFAPYWLALWLVTHKTQSPELTVFSIQNNERVS